jgi:hypothetical protein
MRLVRHHAECYHARAMSYDRLAQRYPEFTKDFSIIGGIEKSLLATYNDQGIRKYIKVSTNQAQVSEHEDVFKHMLDDAEPVTPDVLDDELIARVFSPKGSKPKLRQEMSAYIPPVRLP